MSTVLYNNKFLPANQPILLANNRGFRYGDGFFETCLIQHGRIQLADYHLDRMGRSLQALRFDVPKLKSPERWLTQAIELAQRNNHHQLGRIRLTFFRGSGGLFDPENLQPNVLIESWELADHVSHWNENGLVLGIAEGLAKSTDSLANLKHNNYLLYAMAALEAKQKQWNDALLENTRGSIADSTIANLFIVEGNKLITPPLLDGPVAGVRRRHILALAPQLGWQVAEATITKERLLRADEVFLSNAIRPVRWVQRIDNQEFGNKQTYAFYLRYRATIS